MIRTRNFLVLLTASLVSAPLLYFSVLPTSLVRIDILPSSLNAVRILTTSTVSERESRGAVYFEFRALASNPAVKNVSIAIRPYIVREWFQAHDVTVSDGLILSTLQLGSAEYPMGKHAQFAYKLQADTNNVLSEGIIKATSESVAGGQPWLIAAIGLIASIIQVLTIVLTSGTQQVAGRSRRVKDK